MEVVVVLERADTEIMSERAVYRTRFAPSPTGALHLGNARTFLLSWLRARSQGGEILMRMEDLDHPRVKIEKVEQVYADLRWLGLDWDGEIMVQSRRVEIYREIFKVLQQKGLVYPCFCSRADIQAAQSAPNLGDDLVYPNICRDNKSNIKAVAAERGCAWRFNLQDCRILKYYDNFLGWREADIRRTSGDFVVARTAASGLISVAYQLACVIDDHESAVTEVIRADDLVNSTFRQRMLYKALGYGFPEFLHVPLVIGNDGRRLAKRHGDSRISCLRARGQRPERLLGWLGQTCGLCAKGEEVELGELLSRFELGLIPKSRVTVTAADLEYLGF